MQANDAGNVVEGPWPSMTERKVAHADGMLAHAEGCLVDCLIAGRTVDGDDYFEMSPLGLDETIKLLQSALRFLQRMK